MLRRFCTPLATTTFHNSVRLASGPKSKIGDDYYSGSAPDVYGDMLEQARCVGDDSVTDDDLSVSAFNLDNIISPQHADKKATSTSTAPTPAFEQGGEKQKQFVPLSTEQVQQAFERIVSQYEASSFALGLFDSSDLVWALLTRRVAPSNSEDERSLALLGDMVEVSWAPTDNVALANKTPFKISNEQRKLYSPRFRFLVRSTEVASTISQWLQSPHTLFSRTLVEAEKFETRHEKMRKVQVASATTDLSVKTNPLKHSPHASITQQQPMSRFTKAQVVPPSRDLDGTDDLYQEEIAIQQLDDGEVEIGPDNVRSLSATSRFSKCFGSKRAQDAAVLMEQMLKEYDGIATNSLRTVTLEDIRTFSPLIKALKTHSQLPSTEKLKQQQQLHPHDNAKYSSYQIYPAHVFTTWLPFLRQITMYSMYDPYAGDAITDILKGILDGAVRAPTQLTSNESGPSADSNVDPQSSLFHPTIGYAERCIVLGELLTAASVESGCTPVATIAHQLISFGKTTRVSVTVRDKTLTACAPLQIPSVMISLSPQVPQQPLSSRTPNIVELHLDEIISNYCPAVATTGTIQTVSAHGIADPSGENNHSVGHQIRLPPPSFETIRSLNRVLHRDTKRQLDWQLRQINRVGPAAVRWIREVYPSTSREMSAEEAEVLNSNGARAIKCVENSDTPNLPQQQQHAGRRTLQVRRNEVLRRLRVLPEKKRQAIVCAAQERRDYLTNAGNTRHNAGVNSSGKKVDFKLKRVRSSEMSPMALGVTSYFQQLPWRYGEAAKALRSAQKQQLEGELAIAGTPDNSNSPNVADASSPDGKVDVISGYSSLEDEKQAMVESVSEDRAKEFLEAVRKRHDTLSPSQQRFLQQVAEDLREVKSVDDSDQQMPEATPPSSSSTMGNLLAHIAQIKKDRDTAPVAADILFETMEDGNEVAEAILDPNHLAAVAETVKHAKADGKLSMTSKSLLNTISGRRSPSEAKNTKMKRMVPYNDEPEERPSTTTSTSTSATLTPSLKEYKSPLFGGLVPRGEWRTFDEISREKMRNGQGNLITGEE